MNRRLCAVLMLFPGMAFAQQDKMPTMKDQVAMAKKVVVENFLDPDGAKFRGLTGFGAKNGKNAALVALCGEVNGKNSYGAYIGFKRFYIIGFSYYKIESSDTPIAYDVTCKGDVVYEAK